MIDLIHALNVSGMARDVGTRMGLTERECTILAVGGLFHDIGKMNIPPKILDKPGSLTKDERSIIELHTQLGYSLLRNMPDAIHKEVSHIALNHHERMDASGYLRKPASEQPIMVRIVAACDVLDALLTDRPYRRAWAWSGAKDYMMESAGTLFDSDVVDALLAVLEPKLSKGA